MSVSSYTKKMKKEKDTRELTIQLWTTGCSYQSYSGRPTKEKRCLKVRVWDKSSLKETIAAEIEPEVFHGNSLKGEIDFVRPFFIDVKTKAGNANTIDCVQS